MKILAVPRASNVQRILANNLVTNSTLANPKSQIKLSNNRSGTLFLTQHIKEEAEALLCAVKAEARTTCPGPPVFWLIDTNPAVAIGKRMKPVTTTTAACKGFGLTLGGDIQI
jgi:hypothetical protein